MMFRFVRNQVKTVGRNIVFGGVVACVVSGCVPLDNGFDETDVSGSVGDQPFEFVSGGADSIGSGYVILLTNTPEFACGSLATPPLEYVSISISGVDRAPVTYDAAGTVFFNAFEGGVSAGEPATGGTVSIDEISTFDGSIIGSVDAWNDSSEIAGSFNIEICF
jgi:hypothetical protein